MSEAGWSCPCCGTEREIDGFYGFYQTPVCPVCGWEEDGAVGPDEPSPRNGGLTLQEAALQFRVFGSIHLWTE